MLCDKVAWPLAPPAASYRDPMRSFAVPLCDASTSEGHLPTDATYNQALGLPTQVTTLDRGQPAQTKLWALITALTPRAADH